MISSLISNDVTWIVFAIRLFREEGDRLYKKVLPLFCAMIWVAPLHGADVEKPCNPLRNVHSFMYQLQGLEERRAVDQLAKSSYDLLVVEPTFTIKDREGFDAAGMVAKLKSGKPGRLVVAYVDIGEAERFRAYWKRSWRVPGKNHEAAPSFLLAPDPDGWKDDVAVAFWDPQWQSIWLGQDGLIEKIMRSGFDGIYMDWIEAYSEEKVIKEAVRQRVNPTRSMVDFLVAIRRKLHEIRPDGVMIAQNAPSLIDEDPRYADSIDGVGFEDTWFGGEADSPWESLKGGDIPNIYRGEDSTAGRIKQYQKYLHAGIPVFTIDYCLNPKNAARVYSEASAAGLIPLVTRISLERLTETPP